MTDKSSPLLKHQHQLFPVTQMNVLLGKLSLSSDSCFDRHKSCLKILHIFTEINF